MTNKQQLKEGCSHDFGYSHKETEQISAGGANERTVDVVVCSMCGEVKRN